ncbi:putative sterigmatocystin biosynthesis peroxidase [Achaetomium macrosporum]|uniref:Sterigmatocystin biosynthesis peroxidase n=1 Tax=Achaetomium macrosporum TaxID=79813 RepID=A0AAN7CK73_9PEZI|nr:putative sterigmatocystin biosynthesis peroxidase [Achaetomium macrosporum]
MRVATLLPLAVFAAGAYGASSSSDPFEQWQRPGDSDVRGPCPFLNTFANHGFLPRSGKYITEQDLANALFNAVHVNQSAAQFLFDFAIRTNPEPNATWFSLDMLTRHNVLEHDASLSRVDNYFGHADVFNDQAFAETRRYWGDVVTAQTGAAAIVGRIRTCNATNPEFSLSDLGFEFILGETAAFISILGDSESFTVDTRRVEYLFRNERLPTALGWRRPDAPFGEASLFERMELLRTEYEKRTGRNTTTPSSPGKRTLGYKGRVSRGGVRVL